MKRLTIYLVAIFCFLSTLASVTRGQITVSTGPGSNFVQEENAGVGPQDSGGIVTGTGDLTQDAPSSSPITATQSLNLGGSATASATTSVTTTFSFQPTSASYQAVGTVSATANEAFLETGATAGFVFDLPFTVDEPVTATFALSTNNPGETTFLTLGDLVHLTSSGSETLLLQPGSYTLEGSDEVKAGLAGGENHSDSFTFSFTATATPEPSSWALGLLAMGTMFYLRRRALGV